MSAGGRKMALMNPLERVRPGSLLVAAPSLVDPNFRRTVVYLIAHGEEGTVGVVLNRPSDTAVFNVLPAWSGHASRPPAVYVGGPVQTSAAMCLGVCRAGVDADRLASTARVTGPVVLVDLDTEPDDLMPDLRGLRIFAGHAGWGRTSWSRRSPRVPGTCWTACPTTSWSVRWSIYGSASCGVNRCRWPSRHTTRATSAGTSPRNWSRNQSVRASSQSAICDLAD